MLHPFQGRNRYDFSWNHSSSRRTSSFELAGAVLSDWKIEPKTFHDRSDCLVSVTDSGRPKVVKESFGCLLGHVGVYWVCRRSNMVCIRIYSCISMHIHTYHIIILAEYDVVFIYTVSPNWNMLSRVILLPFPFECWRAGCCWFQVRSYPLSQSFGSCCCIMGPQQRCYLVVNFQAVGNLKVDELRFFFWNGNRIWCL